VMNQGRLVQLGPPRALYDNPADPFVADFIGEMNLLPGRVAAVSGQSCQVSVAGGAVAGTASPRGLAVGQAVRVAVRPEHIALSPATLDAAGLRGRLAQIVFNGSMTAMLVELPDGTMLRADVSTRSGAAGLEPGSAVTAYWPDAAAIVFVEPNP
jgi:spermidine/putrescine transport system ATP-binding protein